MNKTQEALKMAICDLELCNGAETVENIIIYTHEAINACKEALESQEKEPSFFGWYDNHDIHYEKQTDDSIPLYTNPAQPLSDDEIEQIIADEQIPVRTGKTAKRFARAIEKAIMEKNK